MDLKFSEMSVDTSLAQEYLKKNQPLLELCNDYDGATKNYHPYIYDGKAFIMRGLINDQVCDRNDQGHQNTLLNMAASLKKNASLIAQLEYHFRNIPIEVTNAQLTLIIQFMRCYKDSDIRSGSNTFYPNGSLLKFASQIQMVCITKHILCVSKTTAAICHLLATLLRDAGANEFCLYFAPTRDLFIDDCLATIFPVRDLDSGTVAIVSEDADVDSAVDKFISVSKQAPWHLRKILVQESVYQQFKDALGWKCSSKKTGNKPLSDVLCSDTLTYNGKTFLIDPVELTEENPTVVTVEAYRTTKEMITLVQQDKTRYLSLWTNGIAEINEVMHSVKSPVVWVNNVADFRGPPQVSEAVFSYTYSYIFYPIMKRHKYAKLCELLQSWLKLNVESRREILFGVLDKYLLINPSNNEYFTKIKNILSTYTPKSFVDVGKDYVCIGMSQPFGIMGYTEKTVFSVESFQSILLGNALLDLNTEAKESSSVHALFEQAGVPVIHGVEAEETLRGDGEVLAWKSGFDTLTRAIWTNSGTIFAN